MLVNLCRWFFLGLYNIFTIIPRYLYIGITCIINPKKGANLKFKGKPVIPIMMISLTLTIYFICIFVSSKWYVQQLKIKYLADDIKRSTKILEKEEIEITNEKTEDDGNIETTTDNDASKYKNISYLSVDFTDLLKKNSETVGWIKVNNTNVNYSIVQHSDNDYYLKHDFNQKMNINGWVYADYRDNFERFGANTIIYAHNMTNRTMFGSLVWVLKDSWYKKTENHYIKVSTPTTNTIWKIFSIYTIKPETYYLKTYFDTNDEYKEFLDTITKRSIYNFNEELTADNKVLTLSTCTDDGTKRIVIHAKLIKAEYK